MKLCWIVLVTWYGVYAAESDWSSCPSVCKCKWVSGKKMAECSSQQLTTVPDSLSPEIQYIDLSNNSLASLTSEAFSAVGLVNLQKIFLRECGIQELHKDAFKGLTNLIELDLSSNRIHSIHPETFRDNARLRFLLIHHNPITKLEDGLFTNLTYLQTVDMAYCHLKNIGNKTFMNVPYLKKLVLNGNRLMHMNVAVVEHLDRLTSLVLHNNPWRCDCCLREFRDWTIDKNLNIQPISCAEPCHLANELWTDIDSNDFVCKPQTLCPPPDISAVESDWSSCLTVCKCKCVLDKKLVECSNQQLTTVPDRLHPETRSIDLSKNNLSSLPSEAFSAVGLVNLHKIFLRECGIQELHKDAFKGLPVLIELDLSSNRIHSIDPVTFRDNMRLRILLMHHNPITKLEDGLFTNMIFLHTVDMSNCHLENIGHKTFMNVPTLQHLILNGNNLVHMNVAVVENLDRLTSLVLHNNPWRCDCYLKEFRDWTIDKNLYVQPTSCAEPPYHAYKLWTEIDSNDFACKPQVLYPPSDTTVEALGKEVTISCKVTGNPPPEVYWVINSRIISNNTRTSNGDSRYVLREGEGWLNLTIGQVQVQDRGNLTCVARSPGGLDERNVTLVVPPGGPGYNHSSSGCALPSTSSSRRFCSLANGCDAACDFDNEKCLLPPGSSEDQVKVVCAPGYSTRNPHTSEVAICLSNGLRWYPPLPECHKMCPSLKSEMLLMTCRLGTNIVNCSKPALPDTIVSFECAPTFSEYPDLSREGAYRRIHTCKTSGEWSDYLPKCKPACGVFNKNANEFTPTILEDQNAHLGAPWHAGLYYREEKNGNVSWNLKCGGSLISKRFILTASHCVKDVVDDMGSLRIALGKYYRSWDIIERSEQRRKVSAISLPSQFTSSTLSFDIALILMSESIRYGEYVMPVCRETGPGINTFQGGNLYVVGWGKTTKDGTLSDVLLFNKVGAMNDDDCRKAVPSFYNTYEKICSVGNNSESITQQGDSGGGLTVTSGDGPHYIVGIVSLKVDNVTLFTHIKWKTHIDWIENEIRRLEREHVRDQ